MWFGLIKIFKKVVHMIYLFIVPIVIRKYVRRRERKGHQVFGGGEQGQTRASQDKGKSAEYRLARKTTIMYSRRRRKRHPRRYTLQLGYARRPILCKWLWLCLCPRPGPSTSIRYSVQTPISGGNVGPVVSKFSLFIFFSIVSCFQACPKRFAS